jgi:hypothetical protein
MNIIMTEEDADKALSELDNSDLIHLYERTVRHWHYCPTRCMCFSRYDKPIPTNPDRIRSHILKRMQGG